MRLPRLIAAFALLFAACAPVGAQRLPHATGDLSAPASASPSPIAVVMSTYGSFQIKTQPLDTCALAIKVDPGSLGDGPPKTLTAKADLNGIVQWTYATPLIPAGHGRHDGACWSTRWMSSGPSPLRTRWRSRCTSSGTSGAASERAPAPTGTGSKRSPTRCFRAST